MRYADELFCTLRDRSYKVRDAASRPPRVILQARARSLVGPSRRERTTFPEPLAWRRPVLHRGAGGVDRGQLIRAARAARPPIRAPAKIPAIVPTAQPYMRVISSVAFVAPGCRH